MPHGLNDAETFFYDNAGFATPLNGDALAARIANGKRFAMVEKALVSGPYEVLVTPDDGPWDGDVEYNGPLWNVALFRFVDDGESELLGSVSGVACQTDADPYIRVVSAELASEHIGVLAHHWHIANGLSGYGPDGSEEYDTAYTPETLADDARGHLDQWAQQETESASAYAETGDYEAAWKLREHADSLADLSANLDNSRATAPLYVNDRPKWQDTIMRTFAERFPLSVDEGRSKIYAWECLNADCDQADDQK